MAEAKKIIDIYNKLDSDKGVLKSHLQEIADYMIPSKQGSFTQATTGGKRMSKIYDATAIRALRTFANGLYGHLTSPAYPWFELTGKNKAIMNSPTVKFWLSDVTERMRTAINSSNAVMALHEVYTDEGWAGTGILYIEPGRKYLLNFQTLSVVNCCITEDFNGVVDGVYRLEKMTARQCVQQWGDKCSEAILKAYKGDDQFRTFDIIHAVYPRDDYNWQKIDSLNMPYASVYIEREGKNILSESGYREFPYAVPRWEKDPGEVYGRSPAMDALPDVKMLNQMCYDNMRGVQKMIDPPLLATKESSLSTTRTAPASVIYYKSGEKPEPLQTGARFDIALEVENKRRESINQAFYTDLFMLLAENNDPRMTAYEVRQRVEEKLTLLGPALGRQQSELFDAMLSRVFWIMLRGGYLPPVPQELMGQGLEVEYIGRLALAMKSVETQAAGNALQFVGSLAQADPSIMDNFDLDEIAQGTAQRSGMPIKYLRPPDARDKIRSQRAQMQAQQAADAQVLEAAKVMPGLSKTMESGSPAEALLGG